MSPEQKSSAVDERNSHFYLRLDKRLTIKERNVLCSRSLSAGRVIFPRVSIPLSPRARELSKMKMKSVCFMNLAALLHAVNARVSSGLAGTFHLEE